MAGSRLASRIAAAADSLLPLPYDSTDTSVGATKRSIRPLVSAMSFTGKLDVKLIRNVRDNPVLYDHNHSRYMDFNEREVVWQKIGDELRKPAGECKSRWINIRDIYRRKLRKQMSSPGQCRKKAYKYEREISFLRSYFREVVTNPVAFDDNLNDQLIDDDNDADPDDPVVDDVSYSNQCSDESDEDKKAIKFFKKNALTSISSRKKRKKSRVEVVKTLPSSSTEAPGPAEFDTSDPVDAFLLSIGATLKTFSPYHLNLAKSEIFSVVQQHDLKQIVEKQNQNLPPNQDDVKVCPMETMYNNV